MKSVNSKVSLFLAAASLEYQDRVLMLSAGLRCSHVARHLETVAIFQPSSVCINNDQENYSLQCPV